MSGGLSLICEPLSIARQGPGNLASGVFGCSPILLSILGPTVVK